MDEVIPGHCHHRWQRNGSGSFGGPRTPAIVGSMIACILLAGSALQQRQALQAEVRQPSEYEVKAAFLLNFTKFVEWPKSENAADAPFSICVLGSDPFGSILDQIVQGEQVQGRKLVVERVSRVQPFCNVLFVAKSEKNISSALGETGSGVLTVGETEDFLKQGGMIAFSVENRRVRFDISQRAAAQGALQISSRLFHVARMVEK